MTVFVKSVGTKSNKSIQINTNKLENPLNYADQDLQAFRGDNVAGKNKSKRCSNAQTEK